MFITSTLNKVLGKLNILFWIMQSDQMGDDK